MGSKAKEKQFVYDEEDGLMPEIEKLTLPLGATLTSKSQQRAAEKAAEAAATQVSKWKSVNAQYCNVCKEGGELLCCDSCPASFHLICHQPIIHRDDIPEGKWSCNRCVNTPAGCIPSKSSIDPNETEDDRNRRAAMRVLADSDSCEDPLALLTQAATAINAQEFELPAEYNTGDCHVPHEELRIPHQPIYGEECSSCSEVKEKLLQVRCDFCSGVYHLDCLNPPLCSLPKDRWMCPNHVEHIVDQKLLKSLSITERRGHWEKYARQEIDELTVMRGFLTKIRKVKASTSAVRRLNVRPVTVRTGIKDLYRRRWDATPASKKKIFKTREEQEAYVTSVATTEAKKIIAKTLNQKKEKTKEVFDMDQHQKKISINKFMKKKRLETSVKPSILKESSVPVKEDAQSLIASNGKPIAYVKNKFNSGGRSKEKDAETLSILRNENEEENTLASTGDVKPEQSKLDVGEESEAAMPLVDRGIMTMSAEDEEMKEVEEAAVRGRAAAGKDLYQGKKMGVEEEKNIYKHKQEERSEEAKKEEETILAKRESNEEKVIKKGTKMKIMIVKKDIKRDKKDENKLIKNENVVVNGGILRYCQDRLKEVTDEEKIVYALAIERLQQIKKDTECLKERQKLDWKTPRANFESKCFLSNQPIIAVLKMEKQFVQKNISDDYLPISLHYKPISIQRNVTSLGTSEECHIGLLDFTPQLCSALSKHHADIIFDRTTSKFELALVGCSRATVDGVEYGVDMTNTHLMCICSNRSNSTHTCRPLSLTAPLRHGSTVSLGCVTFRFASYH